MNARFWIAGLTAAVLGLQVYVQGMSASAAPQRDAAVGLAAYGTWQGVLAMRWGHLPSSETAGINLGFPLAGYLAELASRPDGTALVTMAWYALMVWIWAWAWRSAPSGVTLEKCALAGFLLLTTVFSTFIWSGAISAMRQLAHCAVLGACVAMRGGAASPSGRAGGIADLLGGAGRAVYRLQPAALVPLNSPRE